MSRSGNPAHSAEEWVADVAPRGCGDAQHALRPSIEARHALEQHIAEATGECSAVVAGDLEKFLCVEGVALGAGDDRVPQRRW